MRQLVVSMFASVGEHEKSRKGLHMRLAYRLGVSAVVLLLSACGADNKNKSANTGGGDISGAGNTSSGATSMGGSSSSGGDNTMATAGLPSLTEAGAPMTGVSKGKVGVWENITPKGINLDPTANSGDNFGIQDVLADPVRPTDLYAFVCYQGVWRSQDYGDTWVQVNTGDGWGKPWGTAISPQMDRANTKSPVLMAGPSSPIGFLKSVDFGVTWSVTKLPDDFGDFRYQQVYSIDIDPYDVNHIIIAFHEAPDVGESTDGGMTWTKHPTPAGQGTSYYPFFLNTGKAETTRLTWMTFPQETSTGKGLRTDDGGKTWVELGKFQHHHGSAQLFDAGGGNVYVASMNPMGVQKSTDYGVTFTQVTDMSNGVVTGSMKFLYASVGVGYVKPTDNFDPQLIQAPIADDTNWTKMDRPTDMFDGAKRIAVTHDEMHEIVVSGNWHAGIWRYIEP
jgi:hypothetical protein